MKASRSKDSESSASLHGSFSDSGTSLFSPSTPLAVSLRKKKAGGECRIRTYEGFAGRFTVCSHWPLGQLPGRNGFIPHSTPIIRRVAPACALAGADILRCVGTADELLKRLERA